MKNISQNDCQFQIGDIVRFSPNERTKGHYQNIEFVGIKVGDEQKICSIIDNTYLYFGNNVGGWSWNEFVLVSSSKK